MTPKQSPDGVESTMDGMRRVPKPLSSYLCGRHYAKHSQAQVLRACTHIVGKGSGNQNPNGQNNATLRLTLWIGPDRCLARHVLPSEERRTKLPPA